MTMYNNMVRLNTQKNCKYGQLSGCKGMNQYQHQQNTDIW